MAKNDPSPEEIADLERQQREAELQAEFDEFEREERERKQRQEEYDRERARIEIERQKIETTAGKKSYTGFRAIDEYLDASDTKREKAAADKWEKEYKDIETREKSGKITPDYASFLKTQAGEKYQASRKSKARYLVEEAQRTGSGLIAAGGSYLSNAPTRSGGSRKKPSLKSSGRSRASPRQNGFSSGIGMGVSFPQMGVSAPQQSSRGNGRQPRQPAQMGFPSFTVSTPKSKAPAGKPVGLGMSSGLGKMTGSGKPSGPKFPTMAFTAAPKFGKSLLTPRDPFGAKKTNPVKGRKKTLW